MRPHGILRSTEGNSKEADQDHLLMIRSRSQDKMLEGHVRPPHEADQTDLEGDDASATA